MIQKKLDTKATSLGKLDLSFWQEHLDELLNCSSRDHFPTTVNFPTTNAEESGMNVGFSCK